ncbi:MAG TPA: TonB family protein [Pyrinomonadaceae bacterium]|jgi:protein TonB
MFNNLVESDLHTQEHVRRSWFFLGTLAAYTLLMMIAGVASIYAYDAHLEEQTNEYIITFVPPPQPEAATPQRPNPPRATIVPDTSRRVSERPEAIGRIADSTKPPDQISSAPSRVRELPAGPVAITGRDYDAVTSNIPGSPTGGNGVPGDASRPVHVEITETPPQPPPRATPTPQPVKVLRTSTLLNSKAVRLPKPRYPEMARIAKAYGPVNVQVMLDETGKVVSAQAVSGHPLLRAAAVQAAYQAQFTPTILGDRPVKVSGVITYNFTF